MKPCQEAKTALCGLSTCFLPSSRLHLFLLPQGPFEAPRRAQLLARGGHSLRPLGGKGYTRRPSKTRRWVGRTFMTLFTLVEIRIRPWTGRRACFGLCPSAVERRAYPGKRKRLSDSIKKYLRTTGTKKAQPEIMQPSLTELERRHITCTVATVKCWETAGF